MKPPPDAIVIWRCGNCADEASGKRRGGLRPRQRPVVGYVRRASGSLVYAKNGVFKRQIKGENVRGVDKKRHRNVTPAELPVDDLFAADRRSKRSVLAHASADFLADEAAVASFLRPVPSDPLTVTTCGRHTLFVTVDSLRPALQGVRTVLLRERNERRRPPVHTDV